MFCQKCGHENADDCIFCVSCGENLECQMEEETIKVDSASSYKKIDKSDMTGGEKMSHQEEAKTPPPSDNTFSDSSGNNFSDSSKAGQPTNNLASISLVLGVFNIFICCGSFVIPLVGPICYIVFPLISLVGLLLGIIGKIQISRSGGTQKGNDVAIIGIVINAIWVVLFIINIILVLCGVVAINLMPLLLDKLDKFK
mgnify:CR=1 FL=1